MKLVLLGMLLPCAVILKKSFLAVMMMFVT